MRNGPNVSYIHKAPIGSQVLKKWEGPFKLLKLALWSATIARSSSELLLSSPIKTWRKQ